MKLAALILLPLALAPSLVRADTAAEAKVSSTGEIFEMGSNFGKLVARYEMRKRQEADGGLTTIHRYTDPASGKLLVQEEMRTSGTGKPVEYRQDQLQQGAKGTLQVADGKLDFQWEEGPKKKHETETLDEATIAPPMLPDQIRSRWAELMDGKSVKVRLAVLDRAETVGFKIEKNEESDFQGKPAVVFKFKPTSIVIQALVDPIFLTFERSSKVLLRVLGRMPIKRVDGERLKDFDGDTVYRAVATP